MEYVYKHDIDRFVQWTIRVWDVDLSLDDKDAIVKEGIRRLMEWSKSIGMPTTLTEANIPFDKFEEMVDNVQPMIVLQLVILCQCIRKMY